MEKEFTLFKDLQTYLNNVTSKIHGLSIVVFFWILKLKPSKKFNI